MRQTDRSRQTEKHPILVKPSTVRTEKPSTVRMEKPGDLDNSIYSRTTPGGEGVSEERGLEIPPTSFNFLCQDITAFKTYRVKTWMESCDLICNQEQLFQISLQKRESWEEMFPVNKCYLPPSCVCTWLRPRYVLRLPEHTQYPFKSLSPQKIHQTPTIHHQSH